MHVQTHTLKAHERCFGYIYVKYVCFWNILFLSLFLFVSYIGIALHLLAPTQVCSSNIDSKWDIVYAKTSKCNIDASLLQP